MALNLESKSHSALNHANYLNLIKQSKVLIFKLYIFSGIGEMEDAHLQENRILKQCVFIENDIYVKCSLLVHMEALERKAFTCVKHMVHLFKRKLFQVEAIPTLSR